MKAAFVLTIVLLSAGCVQHVQINSTRKTFKMPVVKSTVTRKADESKIDSCSISEPFELGKYKFGDTVVFRGKEEENYETDFVPFYNLDQQMDSFNSGGFQIKVDYKTTLIGIENAAMFPTFIVNETSSIKIFPTICLAIQEAQDSTGSWRPIQFSPYARYAICGNSDAGVKVHPDEFMVMCFPKFTGDYKTKMRIRFLMKENLIISEIFYGSIKYSQFYAEKNSNLPGRLKYNYHYFIHHDFLDARPLGYDQYQDP